MAKKTKKNGAEVTRVITCQITLVNKGLDQEMVDHVTDRDSVYMNQKIVASAIKKALDADNVVVTSIKAFWNETEMVRVITCQITLILKDIENYDSDETLIRDMGLQAFRFKHVLESDDVLITSIKDFVNEH